MVRRVLQFGVVAVFAVGMTVLPSGAAPVPLPVEFTSGGVVWGDLPQGFQNNSNICDLDVYRMAEAQLSSTGQGDAFDGAGGVVINGEGYVVPPGTSDAPVDLTGSTLTSASAPVGGVNVSTQWFGLPGQPTIRYLVTLENPSAATLNTAVTIENNAGSDSSTFIQGSSSGQDTTYPTNERWFATSQGDTDPSSDPPMLSVVTGPGAVRAPGTVADCPDTNDDSQVLNDEKAAAEAAAESSATEDAPEGSTVPDGEVPDGEVSAAGTDLDEDDFVYSYNVSIPAGETRYVMVYWSLFETIGESVAAGPAFNTTPALGSPLVEGLSQDVLCDVVNWDFGDCFVLTFTG